MQKARIAKESGLWTVMYGGDIVFKSASREIAMHYALSKVRQGQWRRLQDIYTPKPKG